MTDELCAACGHAERHHDPEDRNCEHHADRGMGRCRCNFFIGEENPAIQNAVEKERAAVVALLRESQRMYQMHRSPGVESLVRNLADIIERGEHRREEAT